MLKTCGRADEQKRWLTWTGVDGVGRALVAGDRVVRANRAALDGCRRAAAKTVETVRCTVRVEGER